MANFLAHFEQQYRSHLKHLKLKGLQPKAIDACARSMRHIGEYLSDPVDAVSVDQLTDYFTDLMALHSWSEVKPDLQGWKFFNEHVLRKPWVPWVMPHFTRPPKFGRLPDIVGVARAQGILRATRVLSYRVFFFTLCGLGLWLGEGLVLTVGDVDAERLRVHGRDAEVAHVGNRDRLLPLPLPQQTLAVVRNYWRAHQHPRLLFPDRAAGGLRGAKAATSALDRGSVQRAVHQATSGSGL